MAWPEGVHATQSRAPVRATDNIVIESLWLCLEYEEGLLARLRGRPGANTGLDRYFRLYNTERRHTALGKLTPADVYFNRAAA